VGEGAGAGVIPAPVLRRFAALLPFFSVDSSSAFVFVRDSSYPRGVTGRGGLFANSSESSGRLLGTSNSGPVTFLGGFHVGARSGRRWGRRSRSLRATVGDRPKPRFEYIGV